MLTKKQHELLSFINDRLEATGISPSFEEMKDALDLKSKSGIHRLISALEERGFLRRLANRARALEILKLPDGMIAANRQPAAFNSASATGSTPSGLGATGSNPLGSNKISTNKISTAAPRFRPAVANDVIDIPLHGRIAAGVPIEAMEGASMLSVPAALLGSGDHYALEVSGDSMIEAGIFDGDYALIQRVDTAREGDIVVALVDNQDATLKYFRREGPVIRLDPANAAYEPQRYAAENVRIQGRLAGLLRRYH